MHLSMSDSGLECDPPPSKLKGKTVPKKGKARERSRRRRKSEKPRRKQGADDGPDSSSEEEDLSLEEYKELLGMMAGGSKKNGAKRPRGRAPKGQEWCSSKGKWVPISAEAEEEEEAESSSCSEEDEDEGSKFNIVFTVAGEDFELDLGALEEEGDTESGEEEDDDDSDWEPDGSDGNEEGGDEEPLPSPEEDLAALAQLTALMDGVPGELRGQPAVVYVEETIKERMKLAEKRIKKGEKKERAKNTDAYKKLVKEKRVMNDVGFFKKKLSLQEQASVLAKMEEVQKHAEIDQPYRLTLAQADLDPALKACAYRKVQALRCLEPGAGEYYKIKNWVDTFMRIPFGIHRTLPLKLSDGADKCHEFMSNARNTLDNAVYGMDDAKSQVLQLVGRWISNPGSLGSALAIQGPMGTGKTTLVKEGISKILGREFAFIALGGATDSSFLDGHSYTYEGATWGKIVDILLRTKCMNPVIYFDELDKVSDTAKGEEIIGLLTHLTDTSQNSEFHDKYFAELDFDLSKCLFIFSYNDESRVNPILRDRMYKISTKGYQEKEKVVIAQKHLLPKIREQISFDESDVIVDDSVVKHIVMTHTGGESGVRTLKRCLEIVHTKLNLCRLTKPGTELFSGQKELNVTFPVTVTPELVDKLIKQEKKSGAWQHMYM